MVPSCWRGNIMETGLLSTLGSLLVPRRFRCLSLRSNPVQPLINAQSV